MMVEQSIENNRVFFEEFNKDDNFSIIKKEDIIKELKNIFDPEIPVNIYDLGLIYEINITDKEEVIVEMTLTSPNCPVAESLPQEVANKIKELKKINKFKSLSVFLTFEPPWNKDMMTEEAKLALDII